MKLEKVLSLKKNFEKVVKNVENIVYGNKHKTITEDDNSNYLRKLIMVQRAAKKFLNIINNKKTKELYSEEFNRQFFANMKIEKISELKQRILTKIKTNNFSHKNNEINFQEVNFIINSLYLKIILSYDKSN